MLWEEVIKRMWLLDDPKLRGSSLPPCPWNVSSAHCSHTGATSRTQPWECIILLQPSGLFKKHQGLHINSQDSRDGCRDLLIQWLPKPSLTCKFPCLFKLLPTNLEWSTSSFGFSLPSVHRASFEYHLGGALIHTFIKCYGNTHEQGNNLPGNGSEKKKRQRLVKHIEADMLQMGSER